jgi:hypothetical protein
VIDGPCLSACTLVLSTLPRNRICTTSRAVLGFHAPFMLDSKGTDIPHPATNAEYGSGLSPPRAELAQKQRWTDAHVQIPKG